jgi:hypothetical protein
VGPWHCIASGEGVCGAVVGAFDQGLPDAIDRGN